jgi:peptide/nickel transport system substrate-binding protein
MTLRRRPSRHAISAAVLLTAGATAAVLAFTTDGSAARRGAAVSDAASGTLVVNINTGPATIDPRDMTSFFDTLGLNFYVRLMAYGTKPGPKGTRQVDAQHMTPYLARSFTVDKARKVYTFKLRTGLRFPSGVPVDAQAVKCSFERSMAGIGSYFLQDGIPGNLTSIEAPNKTTVVLRLKQPDPSILQGWAQPAASIIDCAAEAKEAKTWLATHEVGAGPFRMVSYQPNKQMILAARPAYTAWARRNGVPAPRASRIVINFINSDSTLLLQARRGAANVTIGLSKQSVASLRRNGSVKIGTYPTTIQEQMLLPWDKAPWSNKRFREGVTYAVPYQQILSKIAYGYGKLYFGPLPPLMQFYNAKLSKPRAFNLNKARQLIQSSGVSTPANVTLTIDEGNTVHAQIATLLQSLWKAIGVNLTVQTLAPAEYTSAMFGFKVQSAIRYDGPGVIDAGYYLGYDMRTNVVGIGKNINLMSIPAADTLLDQARRSLNPKTRQSLYNRITTMWRANSPKIVFYNDVATVVLSNATKSFTYYHEPDMRSWSK